MDLLCAGLLVSDILIRPIDVSVFEKDTFTIESLNYCVGGDALNVAMAANRTGLEVCLVGAVGNDLSGKNIHGYALDEAVCDMLQ